MPPPVAPHPAVPDHMALPPPCPCPLQHLFIMHRYYVLTLPPPWPCPLQHLTTLPPPWLPPSWPCSLQHLTTLPPPWPCPLQHLTPLHTPCPCPCPLQHLTSLYSYYVLTPKDIMIPSQLYVLAMAKYGVRDGVWGGLGGVHGQVGARDGACGGGGRGGAGAWTWPSTGLEVVHGGVGRGARAE